MYVRAWLSTFNENCVSPFLRYIRYLANETRFVAQQRRAKPQGIVRRSIIDSETATRAIYYRTIGDSCKSIYCL
jgi:hypothetical protein